MKLAFGAGMLAFGFLMSLAAASAAPREAVVHRFTGPAADGDSPTSIIAGPGGVLYGGLGGYAAQGDGGVFKLTPPLPGHTQWTETLIPFGEGVDGRLALGKDGSIYGTSASGGNDYTGYVFRLTPPGPGQTQWTTTGLHSFSNDKYADGINPSYGVIAGPDGAIYGTTSRGGCCGYPNGGGTAFKLTPPNPGGTEWAFTVLHTFGASDSRCQQYCVPRGQTHLLLGPGGVLYGTTSFGGPLDNGIVYQLTPPKAGQASWAFTILHNFGDNDGIHPEGALIAGANGVFYGTTTGGSGGRSGGGVVFKMTPPTHGEIRWPYNIIHNFTGYGGARLLLGRDGALYGATGGADSIHTSPVCSPCGVVFKLSPPPPETIRWTETVLHDFTGAKGDADRPYDVTFGRDPDGSAAIFGVTLGDVNVPDYGLVFEVRLAP